MIRTPASRRYNIRVICLTLVYAALLISAVFGFRHHLVTGIAAYVVAVLPALPIVAIFGAIGRYLVEEHDEYARMLMVRQTLWATAIALSFATVWGFLESFGMVDHVDAYYAAVLWFGGLGVGAWINRVTLGSGAAC